VHTKCARKLVYVLQCVANQKSLRTAALDGHCEFCVSQLVPVRLAAPHTLRGYRVLGVGVSLHQLGINGEWIYGVM
jgi:hypothetical protein